MEPYWRVINEAGARVLVTEGDVPACAAERDQTAARYIRRIRNQAKRAYAESAWQAMRAGRDLPDAGALSYMGAQAVRLQLTRIKAGESAAWSL